MSGAPRSLGVTTATLSVAASMVGTGVFTTTGLLLEDLSAPTILVAWAVAGLASLAGATAYAELGASHAENGGEYLLLGRIVHHRVGFVAGLTSLVVGFAAPIAACSTAFARYTREVVSLPLPDSVVASGLIVLTTAAHLANVRIGARFLSAVTVIQLACCVALTAGGLWFGEVRNLVPAEGWTAELGTAAFGSALVWVSYAYAGWGAAAYVAGEVRDPGRTLPVALVLGTCLVTALYLAINTAILASAPPEVLRGQVAVAHAAANALVGPAAAAGLSVVVAVGLTGTMLALSLTGSRVAEVMARDVPALAPFVTRGASGSPKAALVALGAVAIAFVVSSTFDALVMFTGFVLALFAIATVLAAGWSRVRDPGRVRPFRVPAAPLVWAVYLVPTTWAVVATCWANPRTLAAGGALLGAASILAVALSRGVSRPPRPS